MRVLLISTYELGHQPVHLASPAAALQAAGHQVATLDLSVEELDLSALPETDAVAFSVPMHTAMRLALPVAGTIRSLFPDLPVAFYGLYAGVGRERSLDGIADVLLAGEYEPGLVDWLSGLNGGPRLAGLHVSRSGSRFEIPDRSRLPAGHRYARLEWEGTTRLAAAVEASHGCRHRCRHCPIPVIYDGRIRVVGAEVVLADIDQLAAAGVEHVTFSDPDFLNAPRYSMDLLRAAHAAHPHLSFDVTVKVEHILLHHSLWPEMRDLGVLFVVSAFESVDDWTLGILDKGHTVSGMAEALLTVRSAGIHIRPTWLPFLPWTKPADLAALVEFLDEHLLWSATDPVQLSIRLLLPEGSLLEQHPAITPYLQGYDPVSLTWRWRFAEPGAEMLHEELESIAANASDCGQEAGATLESMRRSISAAAGRDLGSNPGSGPAAPRLTESWFCCAEPTRTQGAAVGLQIGSVPSP